MIETTTTTTTTTTATNKQTNKSQNHMFCSISVKKNCTERYNILLQKKIKERDASASFGK